MSFGRKLHFSFLLRAHDRVMSPATILSRIFLGLTDLVQSEALRDRATIGANLELSLGDHVDELFQCLAMTHPFRKNLQILVDSLGVIDTPKTIHGASTQNDAALTLQYT